MTEETTVFALDDFEAQDVARMDIIPPGTGRAIGWIDFAGPGHAKTRQISEEATRKRLFEERQKAVNNRWKPPEKTPEQVLDENCKFVAERMVDWSIRSRAEDNTIVELPFSHERAMEILKDPRYGWLYGDALQFAISIENFIPASSQN